MNRKGLTMNFRSVRALSTFLAVPLGLALTFVACGGDDSSGGGAGTDAQYVATVCKAEVKLKNSLTDVGKDPSKLANPADAFNALIGPYEQFIKDIGAAKGPSDVQAYNSTLLKLLNENLATARKTKNVSALAAGTSPKASQEIQDRLNKAAASNKDCKDVGASFGQ